LTVRITIAERGPVRHIVVDGRLTAEEVGELEAVLGDRLEAICLDLTELRSADEAGIALLRRLRLGGVRMRDLAPHLAWRIEEEDG
jgi:hypothetical protein